jgi:hypothetical protein
MSKQLWVELKPPSDVGSITICALRYAATVLPEQTTRLVINSAMQNWTWLSFDEKGVIKKDLKQALQNWLSLTTNLNVWQEFEHWVNQLEQENQQQTKIEIVGLGFLSIYALRYCVGRMTYMPSTIIDATKANWELLQIHDRQQIQNDVQTAITTRHLGMACDRKTWLSFNEWLAENINK